MYYVSIWMSFWVHFVFWLQTQESALVHGRRGLTAGRPYNGTTILQLAAALATWFSHLDHIVRQDAAVQSITFSDI